MSGVRPSVCSSLCPIYRLLLVTVVGLLLGPSMEEIDQQQAPQQHSAQQQMQAVTRCQLMYDLFFMRRYASVVLAVALTDTSEFICFYFLVCLFLHLFSCCFCAIDLSDLCQLLSAC